jgi:hypothetical protein
MLNRNYHYAVHDNGNRVEELGDIELGGDVEALTFGKRVIRDMIHSRDPGRYTGWTMNITEDKRAVGSISFGFDANQNLKRGSFHELASG